MITSKSTTEDVQTWLVEVGFDNVCAKFEENMIDGECLPNLTERSLELLIPIIGPRTKFMKKLDKLKDKCRRFSDAAEVINMSDIEGTSACVAEIDNALGNFNSGNPTTPVAKGDARHEAAVDDAVSNGNSGSLETPVAEGESRYSIVNFINIQHLMDDLHYALNGPVRNKEHVRRTTVLSLVQFLLILARRNLLLKLLKVPVEEVDKALTIRD